MHHRIHNAPPKDYVVPVSCASKDKGDKQEAAVAAERAAAGVSLKETESYEKVGAGERERGTERSTTTSIHLVVHGPCNTQSYIPRLKLRTPDEGQSTRYFPPDRHCAPRNLKSGKLSLNLEGHFFEAMDGYMRVGTFLPTVGESQLLTPPVRQAHKVLSPNQPSSTIL